MNSLGLGYCDDRGDDGFNYIQTENDSRAKEATVPHSHGWWRRKSSVTLGTYLVECSKQPERQFGSTQRHPHCCWGQCDFAISFSSLSVGSLCVDARPWAPNRDSWHKRYRQGHPPSTRAVQSLRRRSIRASRVDSRYPMPTHTLMKNGVRTRTRGIIAKDLRRKRAFAE